MIFSIIGVNYDYKERSLKNFRNMFEWLFRPYFCIMSTFFADFVILFFFLTEIYFAIFFCFSNLYLGNSIGVILFSTEADSSAGFYEIFDS